MDILRYIVIEPYISKAKDTKVMMQCWRYLDSYVIGVPHQTTAVKMDDIECWLHYMAA